jgi:hypothetical protein
MRKKINFSFVKIALLLLVFTVSLLAFRSVLADDNVTAGVTQVDAGIALGNTSPIQTALKVIQVILGFLGLIVVSLIIYAGYIWTISMGQPEKINKAKGIIKGAVIGLIIILSAWGITYFILQKLVGGSNKAVTTMLTNVSTKNLSLGTLGSCSVETVYPEPNTKGVARNTSILVTAKMALDLSSVCINKDTKEACACDNTAACNYLNPKNIQIFKTAEGNSCASANCSGNVQDVEVSVPAGNKTLILHPLGYLGNSSGNVEYGVRLTNDLKTADGQGLFSTCSSNFLEWKFETDTKLDLTPPQVVLNGIFPPVDNAADSVAADAEAKAANATVTVIGCPQIYRPAQKVSIAGIGSSVTADFVPDSNYAGEITDFTAAVSSGKMKLFSGNNLLGSSDIVNNQAVFSGYFTINLTSTVEGNSWSIKIKPATAADTLTVGSNTYIFVSSKDNSGNEILVPTSCSPANVAANIEIALSGNNQIKTSSSGGVLSIYAADTGVYGNNLALGSNSSALSLKKFSGGTEKKETYQIKGLKDKPMNSVIQVNFNEAMNPMTLSGKADAVSSYIKLVNADSSSKGASEGCGKDSDCLSYDCQAGVCVGNYVGGTYSLSNSYQTLEFVSDKECGVNSCGETIYCLPAGSHLALRINAASLKSCATASDCSGFAPFSSCVSGICRDTAQQSNYPLADALHLNGAVDLAFNSLDGNRDKKADGPVKTVYPYFVEGENNLNKRDGYEFSFFISNQIDNTPPTISLTSPRLAEADVDVSRPVVIDFNDLMMNSTLRTGSLMINNGLSDTEHKLMNLRSSTNSPLGFWIDSQNLERGAADGQPDYTSAAIKHSDFFQSVTYISQIGSGVKNIYQNCFKPSIGPSCLSLTEKNPSCCFGTGTNSLDSQGNCVE